MTEKRPSEVIMSSEDPGELVVAAIALARSINPEDQPLLGSMLKTPGFLGRLDSETDYAQPPNFLRIASVIDALKKNPAMSAQSLLIDLMISPVFTESPSRVVLLIEASIAIRPAPPEVVAFWERHTGVESVYMNILMHALMENCSEGAVELFFKKIGDSQYEEKKRIWWMRENIPPHCNDPLVLENCLKMFKGITADKLKIGLVEVLFDFQRTWFRPSTPVSTVPLSAFKPNERLKLHSVGEYALQNLTLPDTLQQAVKDTLKKLNLDEGR